MAVIVIFDPDDVTQAALSFVLQTQGHDVRVARERTELCNLALSTHADLVIMDLGLDREAGFQAISSLKGEGERERVPILTTSAHLGCRDKCMASGASGYLQKPFDLDDFVGAIAALLGGKDSHQPA